MDEFYYRKSYVPAFGSWDCNNEYDDLQFTQCFESARQAGLFRHSYSEEEEEEEEERDLYVAGDLYENHVVTPTVIVVPRRRNRRQEKGGYTKGKEGKKDGWVLCDRHGELKAPPSPDSVSLTPPRRHRAATKAVDEDLYKISPDLLRTQAKRKRAWSFFSSCLQPTCVC